MRRSLLVVTPLAFAICLLQLPGLASAATAWIVRSATGSSGESHAQGLPAAPTGVTATCNAPTTAKTIKVSWSAVTHATTYSVYDSTTSATGSYALVASGVSTTSWTSGTLTAGSNYWFEVAAGVGTNWLGVKSSASIESSIASSSPFCVQP